MLHGVQNYFLEKTAYPPPSADNFTGVRGFVMKNNKNKNRHFYLDQLLVKTKTI